MVKYTINGSAMTDHASAHDELQRALDLPAHYGRNLDALWDCVSTMEGDAVLENADAMLTALGGYGEKLIAVLKEAAERNTGFAFQTVGGDVSADKSAE